MNGDNINLRKTIFHENGIWVILNFWEIYEIWNRTNLIEIFFSCDLPDEETIIELAKELVNDKTNS